MTTWKKCGHPRRPENTCGRSGRLPGGRCRECYRSYFAGHRKTAAYAVTSARYQNSERGRAARIGRLRRYNASAKGLATQERYRSSRYGRTEIKRRRGVYLTPTRNSWIAMWDRCERPGAASYKDYGGRGITVCERWTSFDNFLADMGTRPAGTTLDRINNDGSYEPGNCRWATPKEQRANQRPRRRAA